MSLTEINAIDENYPVAGIDQSSQTFRDNFDNIKVALTDLDLSVVSVIDDLTDVDTLSSPPLTDEVLVFNGADWVPGFSQVVLDVTPQLGGNLDVNGFNLEDGGATILGLNASATPVNWLEIDSADTLASPILSSVGSDVDVGLTLKSKGDGVVVIDSDTSVSRIASSAGSSLEISTPDNAAGNGFGFTLFAGNSTGAGGDGGTIDLRPGTPDGAGEDGRILLRDSLGNIVVRVRGATTGAGVNFFVMRNGIATGSPALDAIGADADINLDLNPKGTGRVRLSGLRFPNTDGLAGHVLRTNGAAGLGFVAPTDLGEFLTASLPDPTLNASSYALATDALLGRTVVRSDGVVWQPIAVEGQVDPTVTPFRVDATAGAFPVLPIDGTVILGSGGAGQDAGLPAAGTVPAGKQITLKNGPATLPSIVTPFAGDTIDGVPGPDAVLLAGALASVTLVSDGVITWFVV